MAIKQSSVKDASDIGNQVSSFKPQVSMDLNFIIHDGPPYANGKPHVGHALNKILKDIIARYKRIQGYNVSFNPGWDCHGLPIEMKSTNSITTSVTDLRRNAFNIASKYIKIQKDIFRSWGVTADWENNYATFDYCYQSKEIQAFNILCSKNLVFRDSLPTYWSCSSKTALAEAELEYNDQHKSRTAFVKFHLHEKYHGFSDSENISLLVWTTTPWSLVANEAVGVCSTHKYVLCSINDSAEKIIIGLFCLERLRRITKKKIHILQEVNGKFLQNCYYRHPIFKDKVCPVLEASFVTEDKGTGLVHVAPAHGKEDFEMMKSFGKYDEVLVDNDGKFTDKCGDSLCGLSVLDCGVDKIISLLDQDLFHDELLVHSYPYDWRTKQPIIIKLSTQWFIDVKKLSHDALKSYEHIKVSPESMNESMYKFIKDRPNWCISRQRKWGVPIPVLYNDKNEALVDNDFIEHISQRIKSQGSDFWWEETIEQLVPEHLLTKWQLKPSKLKKSVDIFDIWFDSGLSWWCTLPPDTVADIYLEGTDQFRGWFSSSLLMGIALKGTSPYKMIVTHGFTVDGEGKKMSKSLGNVIDPEDVVNKYGVDVLRYWACTAGSSQKSNISDKILIRIESQYSSLRNMFRFILGNISDVNLSDVSKLTTEATFRSLLPQDRFILHIVAQDILKPIMESYDRYELEAITPLIEMLLSKVSNFYLTIIKDRLYCDSATSHSYQSCVITLQLLLRSIVPVCAPILPCLYQEVLNAFLKSKRVSEEVFFEFPHFINIWNDVEVETVMRSVVLPLRDSLHSLDLTHHKIITSNKSNPFSELKVEIFANKIQENENLKAFNNFSLDWESYSPLCEILRCASVKLFEGVDSETVWINESEGRWLFKIERRGKESKCSRCRRYTVGNESEECCSRCSLVLKSAAKDRNVIHDS